MYNYLNYIIGITGKYKISKRYYYSNASPYRSDLDFYGKLPGIGQTVPDFQLSKNLPFARPASENSTPKSAPSTVTKRPRPH
jgi:hypothetical protein